MTTNAGASVTHHNMHYNILDLETESNKILKNFSGIL